MRPFLVSVLKCPQCNSCNYHKISPTRVTRIEVPQVAPDVSPFRNSQDFLLDTVESIAGAEGDKPAISEADVYEFMSNAGDKCVIDLLLGVDVLEGSIFCVDCKAEKKIKNSILFME